jgi:hypothetical protein
MRRRQFALILAGLCVVLGSASCGQPESGSSSASSSSEPPPVAQASTDRESTPVPVSPQSDPRFLAADLPLLPVGVDRGVMPLPVIRTAYEFAARHPEVMKYVPCFCGCERSGHRDNHDCFVSARDSKNRVTAWEPHGLVCEICVSVAQQAWQMHNSGASVSAIRTSIEGKYASIATSRGVHTPTPMPKHGGAQD